MAWCQDERLAGCRFPSWERLIVGVRNDTDAGVAVSVGFKCGCRRGCSCVGL